MRTALFGISFLIMLGMARPGAAQPMVPGGGLQRPTVSPYINLARGGNLSNAALNYYGIVRPELRYQQQASQFQQQLAQTNQNLGSLSSMDSADRTIITGRGATFMNYSHYFSTFSTGGVGSFSGGSNPSSGLTVGLMGTNRNQGMMLGSMPNRGGVAPRRR